MALHLPPNLEMFELSFLPQKVMSDSLVTESLLGIRNIVQSNRDRYLLLEMEIEMRDVLRLTPKHPLEDGFG